MLIDGFDLDILTPPCDPGSERYFAKALLRTDISEVLPYLNAELNGAAYTPAANALIWETDGRRVAFHATEIDVSGIESREWARKTIEDLVDLVNDAWERRDQITPSYRTPQRLTPMAVYQHLPQTNCGECGESTCFNFALKITTGLRAPEDCPPLYEPEHAEALTALRPLIEAAAGT